MGEAIRARSILRLISWRSKRHSVGIPRVAQFFGIDWIGKMYSLGRVLNLAALLMFVVAALL